MKNLTGIGQKRILSNLTFESNVNCDIWNFVQKFISISFKFGNLK